MAFELYSGTEAVSITEWSCTTDTAGPDADTTAGKYQLVLDVNDMIAGDTLQIRVYDKARSGDIQRLLQEWILTGAQASPLWMSPEVTLMHGWDFTLDALAGTITVLWSIRDTVRAAKVDVDTIKTNPVVNAGTVTFPTTATLASTTNITAGTIATVTNLTNAPTAGDLTATMKTSVTTAATAATPIAASVTGAVGSVTGAVGSVTGAVGSVTGAVGSVTGNVGGNVVGSTASVTAGVTVTTNNDKTGYGLSSAAVQAIWDALTSALTTVGSIGKKLADWTIGTTQTGDSFVRLGSPAGASVSADIAAVKVDTAAIKTKTDSLTYTVANMADVNIQAVNNVTVNGTGAPGTEWGP